MYKIGSMPKSIPIGYTGETNFRKIEIDMNAWLDKMPDGVPSIVHVRPGESKTDAYVAVTEFDRETGILSWTITAADIGTLEGEGEMQVWLEETENDTVNKRGKSVIVTTKVIEAANDPDENVPSSQEAFLEQVTNLKTQTVTAKEAAEDAQAVAEDAQEAAEQAAEDAENVNLHPAYIDETTKNWMVYDAANHEYVDTQIKAQGEDGQDGQDATPTLVCPAYADLTFPVTKDTLCYKDGTLYKAKQDISTSEAWTAAHWDATNLATEQRLLKNAIDGLKDDTEENFANLVTIINGYDYLHEVMTEGKYAKYYEAALATLSDCNVLEFDVSHVAKFKYNYVVETADLRGLYFVDKNGDYISGVQTIATAQNVTVPSGAVKCYATVINSEDIVVYEIFAGEPPVELLKGQATYTDKDNSGGIKYKWSQDHKTVTISGTRTGASFDQMAGSSSALPTGFEAGKKYRIVFDGISANIQCELLVYVNGTNTVTKRFNKPSVYAIPSDATGLVIRLGVTGSGAVVNNTVNCPGIYTVPDVKGLDDRVTALENAVYTDSKDNPLAFIRRDAGMLSLFHTVGCIGDSLASGESAYKESGPTHYIDLYPFSWGQCLARLTGNTYYNFSKGGLSTKTWLESSYATQCFDGQHNCDMYFIGLGQNDKNQSLTVGTTADINLSDYTQNADTYCGNMGQIIQRLQILQPKAPIFVFIDPAPPSGDQAYNNVIPDIVDLFDNVWIIDLKTYAKALFTEPTEIIGSQLRSGHYSALGYQQIAFVIATYVDWIVRNNLSAFSQVEFIGTNYEW